MNEIDDTNDDVQTGGFGTEFLCFMTGTSDKEQYHEALEGDRDD